MASITTFFGAQGGGGSVSGTATRVAFFGGSPGNPSTTLDDSANLNWDDTNSRLSVGDATTVGSTVTIAGAGDTDATSALEVRTDTTYGNLLHFKLYNNGRIDSRMISSTGTLLSSMAIGYNAGKDLTTGLENTLIGTNAGALITTGQNCTIVGNGAGAALTNRVGHTYVGAAAGNLSNASTGNTAVGAGALRYATTGGSNVAIGVNAANTFPGPGTPTSNPSNGIYIGNSVETSSNAPTNEIVIGDGATGSGSNTVTLGNSSIVNTYFQGNINLADPANIILGSGTGTKIGSSASEKLAFYGDTPNVQPDTFIAGATVNHIGGTSIGANDTFGGYTIAQIAAALIRLGLLA